MKLKRLSAKDFSVAWNGPKTKCVLKRTNGHGGELGCGVSDAVFAFSAPGRTLALSINYQAGYACLESFNKDGMSELVFAEPKDIKEIFGSLSDAKPQAIAQRLSKELS